MSRSTIEATWSLCHGWVGLACILRSVTASDLSTALAAGVIVSDGAMGTAIQAEHLGPADFAGYDGCNEMLNLTRPEVIAGVHQAYFDAGADCVETNTFGANLTALRDYGLAGYIEELAETGAAIARQVADAQADTTRPRWVIGSVGPGTKLASLGQVGYRDLRDAYQRQVAGLIRGGVDAIQIETQQDLLVTRAAVSGTRRAMSASHELPLFVSVTVETTGTMLLGSSVEAVLATLMPLGVDALGLNCATGPDQMRPALRTLAGRSPLALLCLPNAGLPLLGGGGAVYPLTPADFAAAMAGFVTDFGLSLVGGCCGTTPRHIAALVEALGSTPTPVGAAAGEVITLAGRPARPASAVASLYSEVPLAQDVAYLAIGERANAAGSARFRAAMLAGDWSRCVDLAQAQLGQGAHVIDLCVDYVGRDGRADMAELAGRFARELDVPLMVDSSKPEVLQVGLEHLSGRAIVNSVHYEAGDGPGSKFATTMALVKEHGAAVVALLIDETGQARTKAHKLAVAERLITSLTRGYGLRLDDILIDCLTYPIGTGQAETRGDAVATLQAIQSLRARYPEVHLMLGISNISFGLKPAARVVLNSVFLDEARQAGLDAAIVDPGKITALSAIPSAQVEAARALIWNRADSALEAFLAYFAQSAPDQAPTEAEADQPVAQRLRQHILRGTATRLSADLDEALELKPALDIINQDLLDAMREVGQRFGDGRMQLPFVLKSAEVMKQAVSYLEPRLDRSKATGKGQLVLATVRGDVHDIGKNLVDIVASNNGYHVVNLGIKVPISDIIAAAEAIGADAIGLSGLLVKSTEVMREYLSELDAAGLAQKYPVLLGGAALTRDYVETDLAAVFPGQVYYAKDAFAGLRLMDDIMAAKAERRAVTTARTPARVRVTSPVAVSGEPDGPVEPASVRSGVTRPVPDEGIAVPRPPFFGSRVARANVTEVAPWLDERALFAGRWGLKAGVDGPTYEELVAGQGRPRLRYWLDQAYRDNLFDFQVVWGYWPCHSELNDLVVEADRPVRFSFPRQPGGERLCLADYFRDADEAQRFGPDVVAFQLVTVGSKVSGRTAGLFAANQYRDYFELHGLSVQLAEAMAEMWHARIRRELDLGSITPDRQAIIQRQAYPGERFSFGYPAAPDLSQRQAVVALLAAERIGVRLSDEWQLHPEQSTDAMIAHHPQAHYFSVR